MLLLACFLLSLSLWESVIVLCFVVSYDDVHYSFAIFLMGKRGLVGLLSLSTWCLGIIEWLILPVPWV